ncbi:MAG: hypothetical protein ACOX81_02390 [Candidatus Heteroscillospira sp.]|jgi:hypothetical protein
MELELNSGELRQLSEEILGRLIGSDAGFFSGGYGGAERARGKYSPALYPGKAGMSYSEIPVYGAVPADFLRLNRERGEFRFPESGGGPPALADEEAEDVFRESEVWERHPEIGMAGRWDMEAASECLRRDSRRYDAPLEKY